MSDIALHGVNLSGWLKLEPWITPEYFAQAQVLDECAMVKSMSKQTYADLIQYHRSTFIGEIDFKNIAARGFNAVRLCVPFYVFGDAGPFTSQFIGCADYVDQAFDWADEIGLKIVLVLDINPGNEDELSEHVPEFSSFNTYKHDALKTLSALAKRYAYRAALAGFELAVHPRIQKTFAFKRQSGIPAHLLRNYYREGYDIIRSLAGDDVLVIMPDAHEPHMWRSFMASGNYKHTMLDIHLDHFDEYFEMRGALTTQTLLATSKNYLHAAQKNGFKLMVGTWCSALPGLDSAMTPEGHIAQERIYMSDQLDLYRACDAWFFQTWKTQGRLSGWDARHAFSSFERRMICA